MPYANRASVTFPAAARNPATFDSSPASVVTFAPRLPLSGPTTPPKPLLASVSPIFIRP